MSADLLARVEVFRQAENRHSMTRAATRDASSGEEWRCKCGAHFKGDGAIERGRIHTAQEVLLALDEAAVTR